MLANMGILRPSRWQLYFTLASMIAVLDAVVGGSAAAFAAGVAGAPLGLSLGIGGPIAVASAAPQLRWQRHAHVAARASGDVLFPSER